MNAFEISDLAFEKVVWYGLPLIMHNVGDGNNPSKENNSQSWKIEI